MPWRQSGPEKLGGPGLEWGLGKRRQGGIGNPPCNRKSRSGNPPPTAERALLLSQQMTKAPISLQDLRRSLYVKAKAEPSWRFWGLYVHVCKMETLREAYQMARSNDGAPGIDGVTFEAIEESGAKSFLVQIRDELVANTYRPMQERKKEIPKDGGKKVRVLSIPSIRDRVVQGALKLILEPIFVALGKARRRGN